MNIKRKKNKRLMFIKEYKYKNVKYQNTIIMILIKLYVNIVINMLIMMKVKYVILYQWNKVVRVIQII